MKSIRIALPVALMVYATLTCDVLRGQEPAKLATKQIDLGRGIKLELMRIPPGCRSYATGQARPPLFSYAGPLFP